MRLDRREMLVLLGLALTFFVCLLIAPDWSRTEAHRFCNGKPVQVFDSMAACGIEQSPGCTCFRPENPWAYAYWIVALLLVGISGSVLLRSDLLSAVVLLFVALSAAGACALFALSRRESFDEGAWVIWKFVVAVYIAFVMVIFGFSRSARHWILVRRSVP